jgi:hypothetical protein
MPYERCRDVNEAFWAELAALDPGEVSRRTGVAAQNGGFVLPSWRGPLSVEPKARNIFLTQDPTADPGFRVCLTAILYLLRVDPAALGPPVNPLDLPGGTTFFRGLHGLPHGPIEARFGQDLAAFQEAGARLDGERRPQGDAAFAFAVYPGLTVEVNLWLADEEFPAQATFTVPAHLDHFWGLDAIWGLLNLVAQEMVSPPPSAK